MTTTNCEFFNNYSQICGGVSVWGAKTEIDNLKIFDNYFVDFLSSEIKYGGGLFAGKCNINVKNSIIKNCTSYNGGGVCITNSNAVFENCKILNNKAILSDKTDNVCLYLDGGYGGGIFGLSSEGQSVKFKNCNISCNNAQKGGSIAIMPLAPQ